MKYVKSLGLLAVAAAALMVVAGTASATTATSPEGTTYTSTISATSTNIELHGAFQPIRCTHSAASGAVEFHGGATVSGNITSLTFGPKCNYPVTVKNNGSLYINSSNEVFSNGAGVEIHTSVGTCVFTTSNTKIGDLIEGKNAFLTTDSSKIPRTSGNFLCGSSGELTGSYDLTTPNDLWVD